MSRPRRGGRLRGAGRLPEPAEGAGGGPVPEGSARRGTRARGARYLLGGAVVAALLAGSAALVVLAAFRGTRDPGGRPPGAVAPDASPFRFVDVTRESGIGFRHIDGSSGRHHILETYASGLCVFDHDGDGDDDIYFPNGAPLDGPPRGAPPADALYRNEGGFRFTDVTDAAGLGDTRFSLGACAADIDGDGDLDLYVTNWGPDVLYRNEGDGRFTDITAEAGLGHPGCGAGCAFLDIEGDGDLDLYVANYLVFSVAESRPDEHAGVSFYRPPEMFRPEPDALYRNDGNGRFTDISRESGIAKETSWGMGMVAADYDDDGDTDIFVANDVSANFLWRNDGTGRFEDVAIESGTAFDSNGDEQGSMGVDAGDLDSDGRIDFYQTTYSSQLPATYRNLGGGRFADVTISSGSGENQLGKVTWGSNLGDFDDDGRVDIFVAVGHVQDMIDRVSVTERYKERNLIYRNLGGGRFREVSMQSGPGFGVIESSRGSALSDLDGDGDLDIVVLNARATPTILRNDSPDRNHWIDVVLRGVRSNRHGIGASIRVTSGGSTRVGAVHAGRSYQSHYGGRAHFGLGDSPRAERIEVRWPGGGTDALLDVAGDRIVTVEEGSSPVRP